MENRTSLEINKENRVFFEAKLKMPSGHIITETKDSLSDLQRMVNIYLRDGLKLVSADKVERVQVKLIA